MGAPFRQRVADRFVDAGIPVETQEAIRAEVPDSVAVDDNTTVVGRRVEQQILEVETRVGIEEGEGDPRDLMPRQPLRQRLEPSSRETGLRHLAAPARTGQPPHQ